MLRGIDVSENNGRVNWQEVAHSGVQFAIIRIGYGNGHLDGELYRNVNNALLHGLKIGVYFYSYALNVRSARKEAEFVIQTLIDCGLTPEKLHMGVWYDMEDADGYKQRHGMPSTAELTAMCSAFVSALNAAGYSCGIYASLDWLENKIATKQLADYVPYWCAQWGGSCDWPNAKMWQYTDRFLINGCEFDGNYCF